MRVTRSDWAQIMSRIFELTNQGNEGLLKIMIDREVSLDWESSECTLQPSEDGLWASRSIKDDFLNQVLGALLSNLGEEGVVCLASGRARLKIAEMLELQAG